MSQNLQSQQQEKDISSKVSRKNFESEPKVADNLLQNPSDKNAEFYQGDIHLQGDKDLKGGSASKDFLHDDIKQKADKENLQEWADKGDLSAKEHLDLLQGQDITKKTSSDHKDIPAGQQLKGQHHHQQDISSQNKGVHDIHEQGDIHHHESPDIHHHESPDVHHHESPDIHKHHSPDIHQHKGEMHEQKDILGQKEFIHDLHQQQEHEHQHQEHEHQHQEHEHQHQEHEHEHQEHEHQHLGQEHEEHQHQEHQHWHPELQHQEKSNLKGDYQMKDMKDLQGQEAREVQKDEIKQQKHDLKRKQGEIHIGGGQDVLSQGVVSHEPALESHEPQSQGDKFESFGAGKK